MDRIDRNATRRIVLAAALGALGFLLMLIETPLPGFPAFLQYDTGDVPALLAGISLGPIAGVWAEIVKVALFFVSGKDEAGWIGTSANLVTGLSFVLPTAYLVFRRRVPLIWALIAGTVCMVVAMSFANYYFFFPVYGLKGKAAAKFLISASIPFNLVKGTLTSLLTLIVAGRVPWTAHTIKGTRG
jgi:riboflavin transporter FmnP